jgi:tetratricopeptide (TPR) repeat protein
MLHILMVKIKVNYSFKYLLLVVALLFTAVVHVTAQETDTLETAKALGAQQKYKESCQLLETYYAGHQQDLYAGWLYATALHQVKKYKKSQVVFDRLIQLFPDNLDLRLDYAAKLTEAGNFREALYQLNEMGSSLPEPYLLAIGLIKARMYYWQGAYDKAEKEVNQVLAISAKDPQAVSLKKNIDRARSNWLIADASYSSDDQPLQIITPSVKTIFYQKAQFSWGINFNAPVFLETEKTLSSQWLNGFARFSFLGPKISLKINAGGLRLPSTDFDWTAAIHLDKTIWKHLKAGLSAERLPYLATLISLDKKVMQARYSAYVSWSDPNGWMGNAAYDLNSFSSFNNYYYTAGAWLVTPPLKLSVFSFKAGYGFSYSDSKENTFVSDKPLNEIIDNWDTTTVVTGIYDPFFSPDKQTVHSAILIMSVMPVQKLNISLTANYGFLAKAQTPYLYLDKDDNGVIYIHRDFYEDRYHPLQFDGKISYDISGNFSIYGYYTYQRTNFYTLNLFGLTTIYRF